MGYLDDYRSLINGLKAGKADKNERIKEGIRTNFLSGNPSYALVQSINKDGVVEDKEVLTTASSKTLNDAQGELILSHPDQPLESGMILRGLRGKDYLVLRVRQVGEINQEAFIMKINLDIKWMGTNEILESPICVLSKTGSFEKNLFINVPDGLSVGFLQKNNVTKTLIRNKRFMIDDIPYKIIRKIGYEYENVIMLLLAEDQLTGQDVNGICDYVEIVTPAVLPREIVGPITLIRGKSQAYKYLVNGVETQPDEWIIEPSVEFATVDNTGFVTTINNLKYIGKTFNLKARLDLDTESKTITIVSLM